ncbi:MAG: hypothetical protein HYZ00_05490, partial [Candidatus Hydrogenedentes bacterium]|nr:hypothetical protein [Candidatus Hydrogenedentota bacterium]
RPAGCFLAAWGVVVVGTVLQALLGPGWIFSAWPTEHLLELGFLFAILFWSFTLSTRVVEKEEQQRQHLEQEVLARTAELRAALTEVKTLEGLLPICSGCKRIRDDRGYWNEVEDYFQRHTGADFSHGLCPDCAQRLYPEYYRAPK